MTRDDPTAVPSLWWSPSRLGLIEDHGQPRGLVLHQHRNEERLGELPADAVPLVPAGGSAPADEPEYLADVERNAVALAAEIGRMRPIVEAAAAYADSTAAGDDTPEEDTLLDAVAAYRAGGSAPHQGATTDATALLARLDADKQRLIDGGCPSPRVLIDADEVRALLGAATTTAPEATP